MSLERSTNIIKFLSAGPAIKWHIYKALFKREKDNNGAGSPLLSRQYFERYMQKLIKDRFISSVSERMSVRQKRTVPIYYLTPKGVGEFCNLTAAERDFVRVGLPRKGGWVHEIYLAHIIRVIREEERIGKYTVDFIYDDRQMKREHPQRKKGVYFPDLRVRLLSKANANKPVGFNVELDTGSKSRSYWIRKINSWSKNTITLVITLTPERANLLFGYVRKEKGLTHIGFGTYNEYEKNGLTQMRWAWTPEKEFARLNI